MRTLVLAWFLVVLAACGAPAAPQTVARAPSANPAEPRLAASALLARWNKQAERRELVAVDPATGRELPGFAPIALGNGLDLLAPHAFAADRSHVALVESKGKACEPAGIGTSCRARADRLVVLDAAAWHAVRIALPPDGWVWPLVLDRPSQRVAVAFHTAAASTLLVFDARSGARLAQRELLLSPEVLGFSANGSELHVYGQPRASAPGIGRPDPPRALALDAATLATNWEQTLDQVLSGSWCSAACDAEHSEQEYTAWVPAVMPAPDGSRLYVVHADAAKLTTVDWAARDARTAELGHASSLFELLLRAMAGQASAKGMQVGAYKQAVVSPDGARLYVTGTTLDADEQANNGSSLGLQVIDVAQGRIAAEHAADSVGRMRLAPGGAQLLLERWGATTSTEVLDAASLKRLAHLEAWEIQASQSLDGAPLVVGRRSGNNTTELAMFDPRTFAILNTWPADARSLWIVPAGD